MDFEREVARHKDSVYRHMLRVCGNVEDAEDVLVEAMIRAYRASESLGNQGNFKNWLTAIARRVCFRMKHRRRSFASLEALEAAGVPIPRDGSMTAQEELEIEEAQSCVQRAFEALPETYREIYKRVEIEGEPVASAAQALGLTLGNAKVRLHRARSRVRGALDEILKDGARL